MRTYILLFFCTFSLSVFSQFKCEKVTGESCDYEKFSTIHSNYNNALIEKPLTTKATDTSEFFSYPPTGLLTLFFEDNMCPTNVCVYDSFGKCVHNEALQKKNEFEIDLRNQPIGLYVMELRFGNEKAVAKIQLH